MNPRLLAPVPGIKPSPRPTTFKFRDGSRSSALRPTPNPAATPDEALEAFLRAAVSADFVEAARWTFPRTMVLHGAVFHPARPWETTRTGLVVCQTAGCWRVARA